MPLVSPDLGRVLAVSSTGDLVTSLVNTQLWFDNTVLWLVDTDDTELWLVQVSGGGAEQVWVALARGTRTIEQLLGWDHTNHTVWVAVEGRWWQIWNIRSFFQLIECWVRYQWAFARQILPTAAICLPICDFSKFLLTICRWKKSKDWTLLALTRIKNIISNCAPHFVLTIIRVYSEVRPVLEHFITRDTESCNTATLLSGESLSEEVCQRNFMVISPIYGEAPTSTLSLLKVLVLVHLRIYLTDTVINGCLNMKLGCLSSMLTRLAL